MKRISILLTGVLAGALSAAAVATAAGAPATARTSAAAKVQLRHTKIGSILTSSTGLTLYMFTHDHGSENSCLKIHNCPKFWPAVETSGTPVAGPGVRASLLGTIKIAGGARQVTYAGHPLYTFSEDEPGETGYVGASSFGGVWEALSASGHPVK